VCLSFSLLNFESFQSNLKISIFEKILKLGLILIFSILIQKFIFEKPSGPLLGLIVMSH
jgi:hypothetical protein